MLPNMTLAIVYRRNQGVFKPVKNSIGTGKLNSQDCGI